MLKVPASLSGAFETQLGQRKIPDQQRRDFHKWLRFYMDFCTKYAFEPKLTASFAPFDEKLQSKGQSETQWQQACRAIAIYYRMVGEVKSPSTPNSDSLPKSSLASRRLAEPSPASTNQTGLIPTKYQKIRCPQLPTIH